MSGFKPCKLFTSNTAVLARQSLVKYSGRTEAYSSLQLLQPKEKLLLLPPNQPDTGMVKGEMSLQPLVQFRHPGAQNHVDLTDVKAEPE